MSNWTIYIWLHSVYQTLHLIRKIFLFLLKWYNFRKQNQFINMSNFLHLEINYKCVWFFFEKLTSEIWYFHHLQHFTALQCKSVFSWTDFMQTCTFYCYFYLRHSTSNANRTAWVQLACSQIMCLCNVTWTHFLNHMSNSHLHCLRAKVTFSKVVTPRTLYFSDDYISN